MMRSLVDAVGQDVRQAGRAFRHAPGFALVIVVTLALGIGTNTAIFSIVDQLLLRPLPYRDGDRLVRIHETSLRRDSRSDVSPANWLDWQRRSHTLASLAAWDPAAATLTGVGEPERLQTLLVSAEFFPLLGVEPLLGRVISPDDDRPNAPRVAVLGHALWQRRFNGDPAAIGRIIQLNETPTEIIGVMPPTFRFVYQDTDYWTAFRLDRTRAWRDTAGRFMSVVARVAPAASLADARAEMDGIAGELAQTYQFNRESTVELVPLREELVGTVQVSLLVLYGAVVVLLGIVCLNVANLLLARSLSRRRDIAIRSSMGAGRFVIIRQLLVESVALAGLGGLLGVMVARWALDALIALTPPEVVPLSGLPLDRRILTYALGVSVLTGLVVGLVPAVLAARGSLAATLRSGGQTITPSHRVRQLLIAGQVAMTVVLLCGAGLLIRTVTALNRADAGFSRPGLLTMEVQLPIARYGEGRGVEFFRQVRERLRTLPGVESTAAASSLPVTGTPPGRTGVHVFGQPEVPPNELSSAVIRVVTPDYFRTLGVPVLSGREFTDADQVPGADLVFVVNEAFVGKFLRGQEPLSAAITVGMQEKNPYARIVGVVGNVSEGSLWDGGQPTVFYNHRQIPINAMVLLLRASAAPGLVPAAIEEIRKLDANLAVVNARTIDTALGESIGRERLLALVSTTFALSGLLLASLGLYGLLAFIVAERTKEIGVRMALGGTRADILRTVLGSGLRPVTAGAVLGVIGALLASRSLGFLFFGVTPYDAETYVVVLLLLGGVASVATLVPARRAAHVNPSIALRAD
jgi:predicted permease